MRLTFSFFKISGALVIGFLTVGCESPCEIIVEKQNECLGTNNEPNPNCPDEVYECQADCYDEASCEDVKTNSMSLVSCQQACPAVQP